MNCLRSLLSRGQDLPKNRNYRTSYRKFVSEHPSDLRRQCANFLRETEGKHRCEKDEDRQGLFHIFNPLIFSDNMAVMRSRHPSRNLEVRLRMSSSVSRPVLLYNQLMIARRTRSTACRDDETSLIDPRITCIAS